jgi:hypothetical protein
VLRGSSWRSVDTVSFASVRIRRSLRAEHVVFRCARRMGGRILSTSALERTMNVCQLQARPVHSLVCARRSVPIGWIQQTVISAISALFSALGASRRESRLRCRGPSATAQLNVASAACVFSRKRVLAQDRSWEVVAEFSATTRIPPTLHAPTRDYPLRFAFPSRPILPFPQRASATAASFDESWMRLT